MVQAAESATLKDHKHRTKMDGHTTLGFQDLLLAAAAMMMMASLLAEWQNSVVVVEGMLQEWNGQI